ncbi:SDR family oxidoreductase [Gammaproteobacteria bacterium]|nr:SDR family oxidoreductase [Gammaproteobacteria bacterium]MDC0512922.1 SDR family oxidoreductase [Gammaproteobacteria bacterium]
MQKNILVIGGNSLIGQEVIKLSNAKGDNVIATSRSTIDLPLENFIQLDPNENLSGLDALPDSIDALLYCPGSISLKSIQRMDIADIREDFRINVEGAFNIIKKVLPNLKKDDGASVVFISSVAAKSGMTFHSSISASKAALEGFARSLASELAPRVAINCVAPSLTNTPLAKHLLDNEKKLQSSEARHPLNTIGDPVKIAKIIYNLFSAKEDWITGQTISIDGGLSSLR